MSNYSKIISTINNDSTYDFGVVTQTTVTEATLAVANTGTVDATSITAGALSAPFAYKGGTYPGTGGTCGTALANGNCTIVIKYNPTTTGSNSGTLTLNYNNGTSAVSTAVSIVGSAISQAIVSMSDSSPYSYGSVAIGSSISKTFTVTNSGDTASSSMGGTSTSAAFLFKGGTYPGTGGTCGASIASYASCTIVVNFAPIATGAVSALFKLQYNDGIGNQTELKTVTGTGTAFMKSSNLMSKIPIQKIDTTDQELFFEQALRLNGDQINLNNGISISGRDNILIQDGVHSQYLQILDESIEPGATLATLGISKLNIGDIDGDLVDDFIISHFNPANAINPNDQLVFTCISGRDLSVLYTTSIANPNHYILGLSSVVIPQDVDSDGHNDFITGLYEMVDNQLVLRDYKIISAKTGKVITIKKSL